ncbi:MAG: acyl-CoA dehydrogenase family protein [Pseudomonadota bacterium]
MGLDAILAESDGFDMALIDDVFDGAQRFARDVIAPTKISGDRHPAELTLDGIVTSPGCKEAYARFVEDRWQTVSAPDTYGGIGLPHVISAVTDGGIHAANMAFGLVPTPTQSAALVLNTHGTPEQKKAYLPRFVTGEWSGGMGLTEPQSDSDLSTIRTRAARQPNGSFKVTGQKIYINWGDRDCATNIIHLVLARVAPIYEGMNGIQAIDRVARKIKRDQRGEMFRFLDELKEIAHSLGDDVTLREPLEIGIAALRRIGLLLQIPGPC